METYIFDGNSANTLIHQPYFGFASAGVTLDPSASSGSGITLTTSSAYFDTTGSQSGGDYPDYNITGNDTTSELYGDETLWWVFNDKGNIHTESEADPLGLEIHAQVKSNSRKIVL